MPSPRITLGPVQCIACRRFVALVDGTWRDAVPDSQRTTQHHYRKVPHRCPALTRPERKKLRKAVHAAKRGPAHGYSRLSVKDRAGRWVIVDVPTGTIEPSV